MEMEELETKYPCRSKFIRSLFDLIGNTEECFPRAIFVYGHAGTGKTCIVKDFMSLIENEKTRCVLINCVECYSTKILLENILDGLFYKRELQGDQERCESLQEFIKYFQKCNSNNTQRNYVIAFDDAERIRDMEYSILPSLLRIQELTGLNVCVILISQIPFEKYHLRTGLTDVITLQCPQYSKAETLTILGTQFKIARRLLKIHINELWESEEIRNKENILQYDIVEKITYEFFCNYLNAFLSVFYKACRDVPELKMTANKLFLTYIEPVLNGSIEITEISKLWRNIASPLRTALSQVYMRSDDFNKVCDFKII